MGVGKQLRQAREARGLTVGDVAGLTKISSRQIDAIETERYERLPGGIFGRGYVRALAEVVKLDPNAIVRAYQDETEPDHPGVVDQTVPARGGDADEGRRAPTPPPWRIERSEPRMRLEPIDRGPWPGTRLLAAVLIGIGVILLIIWLGRDRPSAPMSRTPAPSRPPVAAAGDGRTPQPIGTAGRIPPPSVAPRNARPVAHDGTEVRVEAERAAWVALTVDGERVAYRMLQPGDTVRATMRSRGTLRTGDAGAVTLAIGTGEPRLVGPSGAVRTIELQAPR
jgi:cytoskeleton protein RodZ